MVSSTQGRNHDVARAAAKTFLESQTSHSAGTTKHINLADSAITDLAPYLDLLRKLPLLETLDLTRNFLSKLPDNFAVMCPGLVKLEIGRLCLVKKCKNNWCKIKTGGYSGWVEKQNLRGRL